MAASASGNVQTAGGQSQGAPGQAYPSTGGKGGGQAAPNMFQQSANAVNTGMAGAFNEMGYQPMQVDASGMNNTGMSVGANDISQFFNPYENQVVNSSLSDIERARQMQANQIGAQAQSAGAFGGSRQALMESELGRNALQQAGNVSSQLRMSGYQNALDAAQNQAQRLQQANQFGAGQSLQAQLANQGASLAGSSQRLAAGNQLANIGNIGFDQAQDVQQNMQQQGNMQQLLQQQLIDATKGQYQNYQDFPAQALSYYTQALGVSPMPQNTTSTRNPGLFDYLTLGASL